MHVLYTLCWEDYSGNVLVYRLQVTLFKMFNKKLTYFEVKYRFKTIIRNSLVTKILFLKSYICIVCVCVCVCVCGGGGGGGESDVFPFVIINIFISKCNLITLNYPLQ